MSPSFVTSFIFIVENSQIHIMVYLISLLIDLISDYIQSILLGRLYFQSDLITSKHGVIHGNPADAADTVLT